MSSTISGRAWTRLALRLALLLEQLQPFELDCASVLLRLALDRFGADAGMDGRSDVDAALGVETSIDTDLQSAERQMLVLQVEPAIALLEKSVRSASAERCRS
jgi:hypothetical protein